MPNILVTGANGFIGRHLTPVLMANGHNVTWMDKAGYGGCQRPHWDGIIHLAAVSRVSDAERDPALCIDTNMLLTAQMLALKPKWFILASTAQPPTSVYGMTKRWAEEYSSYAAKNNGMSLRILRFTNVYGDGDKPDKLLPRLIDHLKNGAQFSLNPAALPAKYIHVNDVVSALIMAIADIEKYPIISSPPATIWTKDIRTKDELYALAMEAGNVVPSDAQPA